MEEQPRMTQAVKAQYKETQTLGVFKVILGLVGSTIILIGSTWGLLGLLSISGVTSLEAEKIVPYTTVMFLGSVVATVVALIICFIIIKFPKSVGLTLRIHATVKHGTGEYFLSPEPKDQTYSTVVRRSLYGSLLVVGIALTVISFDLMVVVETLDIVRVGTFVMLISVIVLPITLMQFYYGPWIVKDAGLFHLDEKDRSLSNVGDDLEDILEFFAGIDIILVWLELTLNTGLEAPWLPIFVILVPLGPLFSIVLNFTLVFMLFKNRATIQMMELLNRERNIPSVFGSADYIRQRVISLVDREIITSAAAAIPASLPAEQMEGQVLPVEQAAKTQSHPMIGIPPPPGSGVEDESDIGLEEE